MTILAITPQEFQETSILWVGAVFALIIAVGTGAAGTAAVLLPLLFKIRAQIDSLERSRNVQRQDIQSVQKDVTQIALSVPAPVQQSTNPPATPQG